MDKNFRMFVKGDIENAKEFTIDLTWRHSAAGTITSINVDSLNENIVTLNLLVDPNRTEDIVKWAKKFSLEVK